MHFGFVGQNSSTRTTGTGSEKGHLEHLSGDVTLSKP